MLSPVLSDFLILNRQELVERCQAKVARRREPTTTLEEKQHGIPLFIDQLIRTLEVEQAGQPLESRRISGSADGTQLHPTEMGDAAARHGRELSQRGFTVEQVVHDYGDLCQAITDLAFEDEAPISVNEFRTLNRCLDNVIAVAIAEYNYQREYIIAGHQAIALNQSIGMFAHELRNLLNTATLALTVIKTENVGLGGATGAVLDRSLVGLRTLIDRSLAEVRIASGDTIPAQLFSLAEFVAEIRLSASLEAETKCCRLRVSPVDPRLALKGDRDLLLAAVGNLLQNAFKFTPVGSEVSLHTHVVAQSIHLDVEDQGAGLQPGEAEKMFTPFTQAAADRSGLGLGLTIARRSVEANKGTISTRNKSPRGCVFTISLPRHLLPPLAEKKSD